MLTAIERNPAATARHPSPQPFDDSICHVTTTGRTDSSRPSPAPYTRPSHPTVAAEIGRGLVPATRRRLRSTARKPPAATAPTRPRPHWWVFSGLGGSVGRHALRRVASLSISP